MEIMIPDATHGAGIFTYIWMMFEVNVDGILHGAYGDDHHGNFHQGEAPRTIIS